jgi:hypothetical protein
MGELIGAGTEISSGLGFVPGLLSLVALGIYALLTSQGENDDDDSTPGGGSDATGCLTLRSRLRFRWFRTGGNGASIVSSHYPMRSGPGRKQEQQ